MVLNEVSINMKDITNCNLWIYRNNERRLVQILEIETPEGIIKIPAKLIRRFLSYSDEQIDYNELKKMRDYNKRNKVVLGSVSSTDKELMITVNERGYAVRVVTGDFVPVPHRIVINAIESSLPCEFERELDFSRGMFGVWTLNLIDKKYAQVGDIIRYRIWAYNYNSGGHSLKIGSGFLVLTCLNGALSSRNLFRKHIVHRYEIDDIAFLVKEAIANQFYNFEYISKRVLDSRGITLNKKMAITYIKTLNLPIHIKGYIEKRFNREYDGTLWSLSQTLSYVGTHYDGLTLNYKIQIQQEASKVLESKYLEQRVSRAIHTT